MAQNCGKKLTPFLPVKVVIVDGAAHPCASTSFPAFQRLWRLPSMSSSFEIKDLRRPSHDC